MDQDHRPFDVLMRCTGVHEDHRHALLWAYDKDNPAAVDLVFVPELISWKFARDLLFTAAVQGAPAGIGDVVVQPSYSSTYGSHLVLTLRNHEDESPEDFVLDRRTAQKFLYATMDLVALGDEDYSAEIDAALSMMRSVE